MGLPSEDDFKRCTRRTKHGCKIKCAKGFWCISGPDKEAVEREAWHYFVQYWDDGEYA